MVKSSVIRLWVVVVIAMLACPRIALADGEPVVLTSTVGTSGATVVTPVVHGNGGQDLTLQWGALAGGKKAGTHAYYLFVTSSSFRDLDAGAVPYMLQFDVASGALRRFVPREKIRLLRREPQALMHGDELDMGGDANEATETQINWPWTLPLCGTAASDGSLYLGVARRPESGALTDPVIVRYLPQTDRFEHVMDLPGIPRSIDVLDGQVTVLLQDTSILASVAMSLDGETSERLGRLEAADVADAAMVHDAKGTMYAAVGGADWRLYTFRHDGTRLTKTRLLADVALSRLRFHMQDGVLYGAATVQTDAGPAERTYRLAGGRAEALDAPPTLDDARDLTADGVHISVRFDQLPPYIRTTDAAGAERTIPIAFPGVAYDNIKVLMADPGGRYIYGSGWPVANIWRYEPATGIMHKYANHYVFYEMHPWQDEIWVTGYWGIKLLRWRPEEPWTFDYTKHYYEKTYPGNTSPWGDKDVSNPRLVAKFRYLKKLFVRRPGGMVIGADGRAYIGGRTPAVNSLDSRYGGAVSWYDPETETIGAVREPFIHHSVRDVCRAGDRYIAAAAAQYISPYEPLPEDFSPGKFVLYDTQERKVVLDTSPIGTALSYAEEGEPGRVVVYGRWGPYATKECIGVFFIFDVAEMRVTHVIRTPLSIGWNEYNVLPFQRGPDNKVYFYGRDKDGLALCRIDSRTGTIEAVVRGDDITNVAVITNPGAAFAFMGDRVYFGCKRLVSIPLSDVIPAADEVQK